MSNIHKISVNGFEQPITSATFSFTGPAPSGRTVLQQVLERQRSYPQAGEKEIVIGANELAKRFVRSWPIVDETGNLVEIREEQVGNCYFNAALEFCAEVEIVSLKPEAK